MPREQEPKFNNLRAANALEHCLRLLKACTNDQEIRGVLAQSRADSETAGRRICIKGEVVFRSALAHTATVDRVLNDVDNAVKKLEAKNTSPSSDSLSKAGPFREQGGSGDLQNYMESWETLLREQGGSGDLQKSTESWNSSE